MKKIMLFLLIAALSCTEPYVYNVREIIEEPYVNPFENCYVVTGTMSREASCNETLAMSVINYRDREKPGTGAYYDRYTICIDESRYVQSDIRLGQIICDLSIYQ